MRVKALFAVAIVVAWCAPATADIPINGSRVHPESITSDAAGNIYTGSTGGTIYRAVAGGTSAELWIKPDAANRTKALVTGSQEPPTRAFVMPGEDQGSVQAAP